MKLEDQLPNELNETLNSLEFDDEAGLVIESVRYLDDDLILTFAIQFEPGKSESKHLWQITIPEVEDERIVRNWTQNIRLYKEHPLLLDYHDIQTELYFNGSTDNSQNLCVDIFQSISQLSDNWTEVADYVFLPERINMICRQGYGLFARGPKTILQLYSECLIKQKIKPIFIGEYEPTVAHRSLKLLQLGESYFIGSSFLFDRLT